MQDRKQAITCFALTEEWYSTVFVFFFYSAVVKFSFIDIPQAAFKIKYKTFEVADILHKHMGSK